MPLSKTKVISIVTILCRLLVGIAFTFSGFMKGIDPFGTVYKMHDYLAAMGMNVPGSIIVAGTFSLIAVEFVSGMFLLFGCYRRISVWITAAMMAFMLPLTAWIAVANPVQDCGCFGDAWVISNTATFVKNIFLSAAVVWLLIYNRRLRAYITPSIQWIELVASGGFILALSMYGYSVQPALDFRPYHVGQAMVPDTETGDEYEAEYTFIYSKDGHEQQFDIDNIPDEEDGWTFVRRQLVKAAEGQDDDRLITIYDADGEDMTQDVLLSKDPTLLLLYPDLDDFNIAATYQINALYDYCERNGIDMAAIVAASPEQLEYFEDVAMPPYPVYTAEDTSIKEVARGCPAIVYLQDGVIKWKTQLRALDLSVLDANPKATDLYRDYSALMPWGMSLLFLLSMLLVTVSLFAIPLRRAYESTRIAEYLGKFKKETKPAAEEETK